MWPLGKTGGAPLAEAMLVREGSKHYWKPERQSSISEHSEECKCNVSDSLVSTQQYEASSSGSDVGNYQQNTKQSRKCMVNVNENT